MYVLELNVALLNCFRQDAKFWTQVNSKDHVVGEFTIIFIASKLSIQSVSFIFFGIISKALQCITLVFQVKRYTDTNRIRALSFCFADLTLRRTSFNPQVNIYHYMNLQLLTNKKPWMIHQHWISWQWLPFPAKAWLRFCVWFSLNCYVWTRLFLWFSEVQTQSKHG